MPFAVLLLLLLTFDHVEDVADDVRDLDDEAEGVDIGREAYNKWIRKGRLGLIGIDVYIQVLTKICTSVRVRTCMRRGKAVVLMVAVW